MSTVRGVDALDLAVARRLRELIEQRQMRHADLAARMSALGLRWTANRVTQVTTGRRSISLLEFAGLCGVFEVEAAEMVVPPWEAPGDSVSLPVGGIVDAHAVAAALRGQRQLWERTVEQNTEDATWIGDHIETTTKAARRLGVSFNTVDDAARKLWGGRVLVEERDARLASYDLGNTAPRSRQARRGHVTRALIAEIAEHLSRQDDQR